jgi:hypothetical protein
MTQSNNPLKQFFRQPVIYLRLPSDGNFWDDKSLTMTQNRELPVYPMTAIDEITYRTPDALFNGQAVVDVIQSCVPAIKNAWNVPSVDINSILVAVRIASYGHAMEAGTTCPGCNKEDEFVLDLRTVLDQMRVPDYTETIKQGDLEITFRPITYEQQNHSNTEQFENQRLIRIIPTSTELTDDEKLKRMTDVMKSITQLTIRALKHSIASIRTPNAIVTEPEFIEEYLTQCDRGVFEQIKERVIKLREDTELRPIKLKCPHCENEYEQPLSLDQASFFGTAS